MAFVTRYNVGRLESVTYCDQDQMAQGNFSPTISLLVRHKNNISIIFFIFIRVVRLADKFASNLPLDGCVLPLGEVGFYSAFQCQPNLDIYNNLRYNWRCNKRLTIDACRRWKLHRADKLCNWIATMIKKQSWYISIRIVWNCLISDDLKKLHRSELLRELHRYLLDSATERYSILEVKWVMFYMNKISLLSFCW